MPTPSDTLERAAEGKLKRPGRLRAAWLALLGAPVVPDQIRAEWAGWAWELQGLCDNITAAAARMNTRAVRGLKKAEERIEELEAECGCHDEEPVTAHGFSDRKRAIRRRLLAERGVDIDQLLTAKRARNNGEMADEPHHQGSN